MESVPPVKLAHGGGFGFFRRARMKVEPIDSNLKYKKRERTTAPFVYTNSTKVVYRPAQV